MMNRNFSLPQIKLSAQQETSLINTTASTVLPSAKNNTSQILNQIYFQNDSPVKVMKGVSIRNYKDNNPQVQRGPRLFVQDQDIEESQQIQAFNLRQMRKSSDFELTKKTPSMPRILFKTELVSDKNAHSSDLKSSTLIANGLGDPNGKTCDTQRNSISSRDTLMRFQIESERGKRITTPGYVGPESFKVYYQKYKEMDKELEEDDNGYSPSTAYISKIRALKILPSPLGLIHHTNNNSTVRANNLNLGKNYALALSSSMKYLSNTQVVDLPGNRFGDQGSAAILGSLVDRVRQINLDNNKIGEEGVKNLVKWIDHMNVRCQLGELSLEKNTINDQMAIELLEALNKSMPPLNYLNISRNNIGDRGAALIAEHFEINYHLKVAKISWNKIRGKGGIQIAEALQNNRRIAYLDASFNQFGTKRNGEFGNKMGDAVNRGILRHLDISYNSMDKNECEIFGEKIKDNHTLWGLHMLGNDCIVDSMGFVRAGLRNTMQTKDILRSQVRDGNSYLQHCKSNKVAKILSYQMCWICEGWSEQRLEWKVGISGRHFQEPIYIHFDFDEYRPWIMSKFSEDESIFYIWKMVPPGKSYYFYSFGGQGGEADVARDQPHAKTNTEKHIREVLIYEFDEKTKTKVQYMQSYTLRSINYVFGVQTKILDAHYDPYKLKAIVPRMNDSIWVRPFVIRPKSPWSVPISIFRDWMPETEEKLEETFQFDCSMIKFPKMTDEEYQDFIVELRKAYPVIKNMYKHHSSIGSSGQVFSLALNSYTDCIKQIGLLDGKHINVSWSDTEFVTINKRQKHSFLNPGLALIRFQFVEILVKMAIRRYEESKEVATKAEAIKMLIDKHLMPNFGYTNPQKWRDERYWKEEVDNLYRSHYPIFDKLFKLYGGHYMRPGDKTFMMADEFESIFVTAGLVNDTFIGRDCYYSFNASLMPQVDEINKDRHLKAYMVEFLEAFARACEKISYPPTYDEEVIIFIIIICSREIYH